MTLEVQLTALETQNRDLSLAQQARLSCDLAKQLEKAGEYEAACEAILAFWPDRDRSPRLEGLDQYARAEVLLRVGNLAGWVGSSEQTGERQETAKDLITRSLEDFTELGADEKIAEALRLYFSLANLKCEPTGSLSLGAVLSDKDRFKDKKICLVVSGGNVDTGVFTTLLQPPQ